jgi:hypothetical protein
MMLKKGDKIRIKDEVSYVTHGRQFPYFAKAMDAFGVKDKVLTISDFTDQGNIVVEEFGFRLHPDWVTLAEIEPEYGSLEDFMDSILAGTSTTWSPAPEDVASILDEAQEILEGDRESDYGDPVANFNRISGIASSILDYTITPEECVVVMMAVKLSREQYKHKRDNLVDLVAYTEIYNRVKEQNN